MFRQFVLQREYLELVHLYCGLSLLWLNRLSELELNSTQQQLKSCFLFLYGAFIAHFLGSLEIPQHYIAQTHVKSHVVQIGVHLLGLVCILLVFFCVHLSTRLSECHTLTKLQESLFVLAFVQVGTTFQHMELFYLEYFTFTCLILDNFGHAVDGQFVTASSLL